jgi:hypothetical protein
MGVKFNPFTSKLDIVDSPSGEFSDIELALGTDTAPSLSFTGDPNTGIYSPGADQVALTTAGSERARIDSSGRLLVGTSSSPSGGYAVAEAALFLVQGRAGSETDSGRINIQRGSVPTIPNQGIGGIYFTDSSNNGYASIESSCDGATGTDDYPGRLVFSTTANGAATPTERMRIDNQGRVGIGTTSPGAKIHIEESLTSGTDQTIQRITTAQGGSFNIRCSDLSSAAPDWEFFTGNSEDIVFSPSSSEKARIDSSGRLLVGTSSSTSVFDKTIELHSDGAATGQPSFETYAYPGPDAPSAGRFSFYKSRGSSVGSNVIVSNGDVLGYLHWLGANGTGYDLAARISAEVDGVPSASGDMPGRLVFATTADGASSPTERMRITSEGYVFVDSTSSALQGSIQTTGTGLKVLSTSSTADAKIECFATSTATRYGIVFSNQTGIVGSISTNGSATAFNISSDYRLKENIVPLTGAANRVNQLQVHRFNFITNPDTTVDGFLAHEAQAVVPECVTGTKDAVDADGNPEYQGIDQSKLVPLLTAALQEALAEIESLKARVTALEP